MKKRAVGQVAAEQALGMQSNLCSGRVVGAVPYVQDDGEQGNIPLGPCLVEPLDEQRVDVFWGESGECSAVLSVHDLKAATLSGRLVLLDASA